MVIDLLIVIALIWLCAASFTDLKKREVSDWLSFSLIAIALSIRSAESIIQRDPSPILTSLSGLGIFLLIALIMYYGKLFAGGDVKLLAALGAVIPSFAFLSNILVAGSIYGLAYSAVLALINFKQFANEFKKNWKVLRAFSIFAIILILFYLITSEILILFFLISVALIVLVFVFVNAVEKSCLIIKVSPEKLTVGDWLFKDVKIKDIIIKADFEGLTKNEIALIRKSGKKVYVKYGIPFVPVFLLAFILTLLFDNVFTIFI